MARGSIDGPAHKVTYRRLKAKSWATLDTGERVRLLRLEKGLSLAQLGGLAGVSYQIVSRVERSDYYHLNVETLKKLARALGVSCGRLLDPEDAKDAETQAEVRAAAPG